MKAVTPHEVTQISAGFEHPLSALHIAHPLHVNFLDILANLSMISATSINVILSATGFKSIPWNSIDCPSKISSKTPVLVNCKNTVKV